MSTSSADRTGTDRADTDRTGTDRADTDRVAALIGGVCPVLETPFRDDGELDLNGFDAVIGHVLDTGVSAMMFPGYASEFLKLDPGERATLVGRLLAVTAGRDDVAAITSVMEHGTRAAVRAAQHLVDTGADALNLLPPYQLGPARREVLNHLRAVLTAVDPVPVIVQYAPAQTGTALDGPTLLALRDEHPNLRFVKVEASPPGPLVGALAAADPPLPSLVGYAGLLLPDAVRRGAVGVQPGCSFVELYLDIWSRYAAGDFAGGDELHAELTGYLSYWMQHVELIVAVEKLISVRRGWFAAAHCRRPGWVLDDAERDQVDRFMAQFGDRLSVRAPAAPVPGGRP